MDSDGKTWLADAGSSGEGGEVGRSKSQEPGFSEAASETVAALLHLIRLIGAELVLNRGSNFAEFEQAVRKQIGHFSSPTANPQARDAGLARAQQLVEHVLSQIRAQAELKHSLSAREGTVGNAEARLAPEPAMAYTRKRSDALN
jgi:hypothetical protein